MNVASMLIIDLSVFVLGSCFFSVEFCVFVFYVLNDAAVFSKLNTLAGARRAIVQNINSKNYKIVRRKHDPKTKTFKLVSILAIYFLVGCQFCDLNRYVVAMGLFDFDWVLNLS